MSFGHPSLIVGPIRANKIIKICRVEIHADLSLAQ